MQCKIASLLCVGNMNRILEASDLFTPLSSHSRVFCILFRKSTDSGHCVTRVWMPTPTHLRYVTWNKLFNVSLPQDLCQYDGHNSIATHLTLVLRQLGELTPTLSVDVVCDSCPASPLGPTHNWAAAVSRASEKAVFPDVDWMSPALKRHGLSEPWRQWLVI